MLSSLYTTTTLSVFCDVLIVNLCWTLYIQNHSQACIIECFFFFIVSVPGSIKDGNLEHIMDFYPEDNNSLQISFKKGFRDLFVYLSEKSTRVDLSC